MPQDPPGGDITVLDAVLAADVERTALLAEAETCHDGLRLAEIHARLDEIGAASAPSRAASILHGLGFDNEAQARPCGEFSGGWRMRVALAGTLFSNPDLLMLDEPSNHLDLEAMLWLTEHLQHFRNTLLMVSHDRDLLNDVCDHIVHIDQPEARRLHRQLRLLRAHARRAPGQRRRPAGQGRRPAQAHAGLRRPLQGQGQQGAPGAVAHEDDREAGARRAACRSTSGSRFNFPPPDILASPIETLDEVSVGYRDGPPVLRNLDLRIDMDDRIALLGQNGNGKSTFIRLLSDRLEPREGTADADAASCASAISRRTRRKSLDYEATPFDHMSRALVPGAGEAKVRAQLGRFGFSRDRANLKVGVLSGGEKTRLLLALATRNAPHMLLLDEPTNHLDMDARASLVDAINDFEGAVVLVSHDTHLVKMVADTLWLVADGTVKPFDGDIDDYQAKLLSERGAKPAKRDERAGRRRARKKDQRKAVGRQSRPASAPLKKARRQRREDARPPHQAARAASGQARRPGDLFGTRHGRHRPAAREGPPGARGRQCRAALAGGAGSLREGGLARSTPRRRRAGAGSRSAGWPAPCPALTT